MLLAKHQVDVTDTNKCYGVSMEQNNKLHKGQNIWVKDKVLDRAYFEKKKNQSMTIKEKYTKCCNQLKDNLMLKVIRWIDEDHIEEHLRMYSNVIGYPVFWQVCGGLKISLWNRCGSNISYRRKVVIDCTKNTNN